MVNVCTVKAGKEGTQTVWYSTQHSVLSIERYWFVCLLNKSTQESQSGQIFRNHRYLHLCLHMHRDINAVLLTTASYDSWAALKLASFTTFWRLKSKYQVTKLDQVNRWRYDFTWHLYTSAYTHRHFSWRTWILNSSPTPTRFRRRDKLSSTVP